MWSNEGLLVPLKSHYIPTATRATTSKRPKKTSFSTSNPALKNRKRWNSVQRRRILKFLPLPFVRLRGGARLLRSQIIEEEY